jgi:murein DD-endopeptidase MepM/ murein hydrolase activator NlpD
MRRPLDSTHTITTKFKETGTGSLGYHLGIDYAAPIGTPVYAPVSGVIAERKETSGPGSGGKQYELHGDDGRWHRLLHLNEFVSSKGDRVNEGQLVGKSGATGDVTGPHLHWDVRKPNTTWNASINNYFDPEVLVTQAAKPQTASASGRRLYFSPIGQTATFYPVKGGTFPMKIKDSSYNWNVLEDQGYRVKVNSASAGGDCWVYIIYQNGADKGKTIPGRTVK